MPTTTLTPEVIKWILQRDAEGAEIHCESMYACYKNEKGQHHREDGPASLYPGGDKYWTQNGKTHREDGPAIERANGDKLWYRHGKMHRVGGPASVSVKRGSQAWMIDGERHREDGPAVVTKTCQEWLIHDELHREDGPAIVYTDGRKPKYYLNGKEYSKLNWSAELMEEESGQGIFDLYKDLKSELCKQKTESDHLAEVTRRVSEENEELKQAIVRTRNQIYMDR